MKKFSIIHFLSAILIYTASAQTTYPVAWTELKDRQHRFPSCGCEHWYREYFHTLLVVREESM